MTYDVSGPERLTMHQVAETFSRVTGRNITYYAETIEEAYEARAHFGAPAWVVGGWITSFAGVAAGEMDVHSDAVLNLTGHTPMTFEEFLRRNHGSRRHLLPT